MNLRKRTGCHVYILMFLNIKWLLHWDMRMSRKPRLEYAGAVYPVMNRGNQQQNIFLTDEDRKCFLATWGRSANGRGGKIQAYVLSFFCLPSEAIPPNANPSSRLAAA